MKAKTFFSEQEKKEIVNSVKKSELRTSGEIRVHLEDTCKINVLDRAAYIFEKLEMHKTAERNGVLFYLAVEDKKFAIIGDAGINAKVPVDFWESTKEIVLKEFKAGNFKQGLMAGIHSAGEQLRTYFPYKTDDKNELSDDISFG